MIQKRFLKKTQEALIEFTKNKQNKLLLITGRPFDATKILENELPGIEYDRVCFNGGLIIKKSTCLKKSLINPEIVNKIKNLTEKNDSIEVNYFYFSNRYCQNKSNKTWPFGDIINCNIINDFCCEDVYKIDVFGDKDILIDLIPDIQKFGVTVQLTADNCLDINNDNGTKGIAIDFYKSVLSNLNNSDVIVYAAGDGINDISLLKKADFSFAMGNSVKDVKSIVNSGVVSSNNEDGIVDIVKLII